MEPIIISDKCFIYNDMPKGWINGKSQPKWHRVAYDMWRCMWTRCYNPMNKNYKWYNDCEVFEDFRCLSYFIKWLEHEEFFNDFKAHPKGWNIDKDIKSFGNRKYYPKYMSLVSKKDNTKEIFDRRGNPMTKRGNEHPRRQNPEKWDKAAKQRRRPILAISLDKRYVLLFLSQKDATKKFPNAHITDCCKKRRNHSLGFKWYYINYKHNKTYRIKEFN